MIRKENLKFSTKVQHVKSIMSVIVPTSRHIILYYIILYYSIRISLTCCYRRRRRRCLRLRWFWCLCWFL